MSERRPHKPRIPFSFKYWRIEVFMNDADYAAVGYSKTEELPLYAGDDRYIQLYQNINDIDSIIIPLSRVAAIKSYAVTE
ncbi:hypothetical protein [Xenorhabdus innexi]|uniref:Uncharacterized protein n=1 Tax=Xenorhabdus innexi TaxID=290109 RepID=A0A1N6MWQ4_9GAMM|nr:hypothetical protein [Xenorhabdus innexi]PHM33314.1 hypothetical protein Xinn_02571 [Xenorhabdus innexi]SIP73305.1 hypothetical protein XIS1_1800028 [Xenorhabdus innexi]